MLTVSKFALVTGASRGIGAAIARAISEQGIGVVLLSRNEQALSEIAGYLQAEGGLAWPLAADVSLAGDLDKVVDFMKKLGGDLRLLVHCAGIAKVGRIAEMSPADWRRVIDVNLTAPFMLTQKMLPLMRKGSQIVFVNSVAGKNSFPEWGAYSASKQGLRALADTLREELRDNGIKVSSLFPTSVDTMLHHDLPHDWDRSKMLKPKEIAKAVVQLMNLPSDVTINEMDIENLAGRF